MSRREKKYHFVYKTVDTRNNKFYIGIHSTNDLNDGYVGSGKRIRHIKHKYGKQVLKCEILEFLPDRASLKKREEEIVNSDLLKEENCMNLRPGGEGGFAYETQLKNSPKGNKKFVEKMLNEEYKKNHRKRITNGLINYFSEHEAHFKNQKHSEETKKQMSLQRKGKGVGNENSQFGSMWITNGKETKKINKGSEIPFGYKKGRKIG